MKICWDVLEGVSLSRCGNFKVNRHIYIEMGSCKGCGEAYLTRKDEIGLFCNRSCANTGKNNAMYGKHHTIESRKKMSVSNSGKNHPMYGKTRIDFGKILSEYNSTRVGVLNPSWKGGIRKRNLPLYNTYAHQIDYIYTKLEL